MIEWVFFDVGNVLFNDDRQAYAAYRYCHRALAELDPNYSFGDMLADRERLSEQLDNWVLYKLVAAQIGATATQELLKRLRKDLAGSYDANHLPNPGIHDVLANLAKDFRLGIIANQPPECRASLERRNLLRYFSVVGISEELDLHKPDPKFFAWALDQAGVAPDRAVMIGDRLDNDVKPARALGMRTIWLKWRDAARKSWRPADPMAHAFLASCDRRALFNAAETPDSAPDRRIERLTEAPAAVRSLTT